MVTSAHSILTVGKLINLSEPPFPQLQRKRNFPLSREAVGAWELTSTERALSEQLQLRGPARGAAEKARATEP